MTAAPGSTESDSIEVARLIRTCARKLWPSSRAAANSASMLGRRDEEILMELATVQSGATPGELARRCHVSPSTISSRLNRLESLGLVERAMDPRDRRRQRVKVTKAALEGRTLGPVSTEDLSAIHALTRAELHSLRGLLRKLAE
ncbi:MarR family winged helix-turn-helix transcriptional regulator [Nocardioides sp. AN3]